VVSLNELEMLKLYVLAVTGRLSHAKSPLVLGPIYHSLESLEVCGLLELVRTPVNDDWVAVDVLKINLLPGLRGFQTSCWWRNKRARRRVCLSSWLSSVKWRQSYGDRMSSPWS
jgi:hypothetical protein